MRVDLPATPAPAMALKDSAERPRVVVLVLDAVLQRLYDREEDVLHGRAGPDAKDDKPPLLSRLTGIKENGKFHSDDHPTAGIKTVMPQKEEGRGKFVQSSMKINNSHIDDK